MKEHPILFTAPMVSAILEGRKTQTRRVVTYRHNGPKGDGKRHPPHPETNRWHRDNGKGLAWHSERPLKASGTCGGGWTDCPYGVEGDHLWVRETWGLGDSGGRLIDPCVNYRADGAQLPLTGHADPATWSLAGSAHEVNDADLLKVKDGWRSARFMFRWACRLVLEVTDVSIQRLQEIGEEDARAEGVEPYSMTEQGIADMQISDCSPNIKKLARLMGPGSFSHKFTFQMLWDGINAKRGFGWNANPWVWVLSFRIAGSKVGR